MMLVGLGVLGALFLVGIIVAVCFRRVVATNEVHIVQSKKATTSYGKDTQSGNVYYEWPQWIPVYGITKIVLPVSVFDIDLTGYEAYDKGRLPFVVDVKAFFRIVDSNMAAQRVSDFKELESQLVAVVQGAVRTILASSEIEEIMQGRSKFGDEFTREVSEQLSSWGVNTVKNIELMDIRDCRDSRVIHNIMEKKKSHIEMESRQEVAKNMKLAQVSEIEAKREVDIEQQTALEKVGLRTAETKRQVEIANESTEQSIKEQQKLTKEREMAVVEVQAVRTAEIQKSVQIVKAKQDAETTVVVAEGELEAKRREAQGIEAEGSAKAAAEKAMQLAPVQAQIELAKEIGSNEGYQQYLVSIRKVEAGQAIGIEQAKALSQADIKVISNTGTPSGGLTDVMDVFSGKGGVKIGEMLEAVSQTDTGKAVLSRLGVNGAEAH